jgi:hypothetical protein
MDMAIMLHVGLPRPPDSRSAMSFLHDTTRLVGLCAFSGSILGLRLVPAKRRSLVPPTAANTNRWVAD